MAAPHKKQPNAHAATRPDDDDGFAPPTAERGALSFMDGSRAVGFDATTATASMLCCQCGATIHHNPTSMCVSCLSQKIDITDGIATQVGSLPWVPIRRAR